MRRESFFTIVVGVCARDNYFIQKQDALGKLGLSSLQKCIATLRMLAYGISANAIDEYC